MKAVMKGRLLKKLNFIPTINSLKQTLPPLHLNSSQKLPTYKCQSLPIYRDEDKAPVSSEIVVEQKSMCEEAEEEEEGEDEEFYSCLTDFGHKCPPGGENSVIFYTTSLRGIRKTFEDCSSVRFLLQSFKVAFYERDVSLHLEFREELWRLLDGRVTPPKLFIKGRYIGGADEVVGLHEQGNLKKLLEGIPPSLSNSTCNGCGNFRFVVCLNCNGSCKVWENNDESCVRCPECNENGLVKCPICCRNL